MTARDERTQRVIASCRPSPTVPAVQEGLDTDVSRRRLVAILVPGIGLSLGGSTDDAWIPAVGPLVGGVAGVLFDACRTAGNLFVVRSVHA